MERERFVPMNFCMAGFKTQICCRRKTENGIYFTEKLKSLDYIKLTTRPFKVFIRGIKITLQSQQTSIQPSKNP